MAETWLRPNVRPWFAGMFAGGVVLLGGLWTALMLAPVEGLWLRGTGWVLTALAGVWLGVLAWGSIQPLLAYSRGRLLLRSHKGRFHQIPIEIVECFLLGQGPAMLPGRRNRRAETVTLVIRLAESAEEWAQRDLPPVVGSWCGGQITVRGTVCEPLGIDLVHRLNARLAEVQAERRMQVAT